MRMVHIFLNVLPQTNMVGDFSRFVFDCVTIAVSDKLAIHVNMAVRKYFTSG